MATLDKLKIKYFDDMVKLEQDKQRIIKMEEKKGMEIRDFFPYARLYRCGCCEVKVRRAGMLCRGCYEMDDCKSCSNGYNQEGSCENCKRVSKHTYIKERQTLDEEYDKYYK